MHVLYRGTELHADCMVRFIKAFNDGDCQRGSVPLSANSDRDDAVKDAKHALELAAEDRLTLVVAMDSSDDESDDADDDDDDDDESMEVDETVNGNSWFLFSQFVFLAFVQIGSGTTLQCEPCTTLFGNTLS